MPELATYLARGPLRSASSSRPRARALSPTDKSSQFAAVIFWLWRPWSLGSAAAAWLVLGTKKGARSRWIREGEAFWRGTLGFVFLCLGWLFSRFLVWEVKESPSYVQRFVWGWGLNLSPYCHGKGKITIGIPANITQRSAGERKQWLNSSSRVAATLISTPWFRTPWTPAATGSIVRVYFWIL